MEAIARRFIDASPEQAACVMFDPSRDPEWIGGAESVDPSIKEPTAKGARVTRHGGFMGRKFSWQTEVIEFEPNQLLKMKFVAGPMKGGDVTYRIQRDGTGSMVSIRNTGPGPQFMSWLVKRSVKKDLARLARLIERSHPITDGAC